MASTGAAAGAATGADDVPPQVKCVEQLALECWLGRADPAGIAAWSAGLSFPDPGAELRRLDSGARVDAFRDVARGLCGYPPRTAAAAVAAIVVLRDLCTSAIERQLPLVDLARAVDQIDAIFVVDNTDPNVPAPVGLVALREVLDWCDASWTLDSNSLLETELRRIREALSAGHEPGAG